jgi:hypothetical protein
MNHNIKLSSSHSYHSPTLSSSPSVNHYTPLHPVPAIRPTSPTPPSAAPSMYKPVIKRTRHAARKHTPGRGVKFRRSWRVSLAWLHAGLVASKLLESIGVAASDAKVAVDGWVQPAAGGAGPCLVFCHSVVIEVLLFGAVGVLARENIG